MSITFADINTILREEDVEGLIVLGAPTDEYESEARIAAEAISNIHAELSEDSIVAVLVAIWAKYFDLGEEEVTLRLPALHVVAQRILAL